MIKIVSEITCERCDKKIAHPYLHVCDPSWKEKLQKATETAIDWALNGHPNNTHHMVNGCYVPKPGRSVLESVCACGRTKKRSDLLSSEDRLCFACPVCDPGFLP